MNLKLDPTYRIKSDRYQFILVEERNGREFHIGFYCSVEGAIEGYLNMKIRTYETDSIESLLKYIKSLSASLSRVLQPLKLKVVQTD